jgi:hypothetical protein
MAIDRELSTREYVNKKMNEEYDNWCKKNNIKQPTELYLPLEEIETLLDGLKPFTHNAKLEYPGQHDGTFLLKDGRVLERYCSFGWRYRYFVYESKEAWFKFEEQFPRGHFWEE